MKFYIIFSNVRQCFQIEQERLCIVALQAVDPGSILNHRINFVRDVFGSEQVAWLIALAFWNEVNNCINRLKYNGSSKILTQNIRIVFCPKTDATTGNRTRIHCLEGNDADHYTTVADELV